MTKHYEWAVNYLENATRGLDVDSTIEYLQDIVMYGAQERGLLGEDIKRTAFKLFNDNMEDILKALADNFSAQTHYELSAWEHIQVGAVCHILETVAKHMLDHTETLTEAHFIQIR
ncbi:hypothetical protein ACEF08_10210 [Streptococcus suis]